MARQSPPAPHRLRPPLMLLLAVMLMPGCATARLAIPPAGEAPGSEHRQVAMRLHGVERRDDALLVWIDIDNRAGEPVVIARAIREQPQYSELFPQLRLVGAGMGAGPSAVQRPGRPAVDRPHLRLAPGEHVRLALRFDAPGIDLANGLAIEAKAWMSGEPGLWIVPIPDQARAGM